MDPTAVANPIRYRIVGEMVTNGPGNHPGARSNLEFEACFSTAQSLDRPQKNVRSTQQNVFALTS